MCFFQDVLGGTFESIPVAVVIGTHDIHGRYFTERVDIGCFVTRDNIQVAGTRFNKRKQAGTVHSFTGRQQVVQVFFTADNKIKGL